MSRVDVLTPSDARSRAWLADDPRPLDWNGPTDRPFTPFRADALDQPIIDHFERVARQHRERIAIRDAGATLTFGELWDGVSGLAETLAANTKPGDLIGILLPAGPMFPLAMLACLASGRPFVALDTHYPRAWLEHVLKNAQPALVIAHDAVGLETCATTTHVTHLTSLPKPARESWRPARLDVDEPACVLFTSGSTGGPKGIVNSQRNILQRVSQSINAAHINAEDRLLTLASPCTIVAVRDVMTALLAGASVRILDPHGVGAREILNAIRVDAVTILFAFPALLGQLASADLEAQMRITNTTSKATREAMQAAFVKVLNDADDQRDITLSDDERFNALYEQLDSTLQTTYGTSAYYIGDDSSGHPADVRCKAGLLLFKETLALPPDDRSFMLRNLFAGE